MQPKMGSVFLCALLAAACVVPGCQKAGERSDNQPRAVSEVLSTQRTRTTIVPTLDTPLAKSGNAVWCAAFQVAWNQARDDMVGAPLRIANAQSVADRLNGSLVTKAALPPGSYYAAAGRLEDGIIETIHSQMSTCITNSLNFRASTNASRIRASFRTCTLRRRGSRSVFALTRAVRR